MTRSDERDSALDKAARKGENRLDDHDRVDAHSRREDGNQEFVLRAEELKARVETVPTTRVVVRKRIEVEERTLVVPVRREIIEVIQQPIEGGCVVPGPLADATDDGVVEMIAYAEDPQIEMRTVAVERVRVSRKRVSDTVHVREQVSHEELVVDDSALSAKAEKNRSAAVERNDQAR